MGKRLAEIRERVLLWQLAPVLLVPVVTLGFAPFTAQLAETPLKIEMYSDYATWAVVAALVYLFGLIFGMVFLARRKKSLAVLVVALSTLIGHKLFYPGIILWPGGVLHTTLPSRSALCQA